MRDQTQKNQTSEFSSKIKNIFIELHGYSYFHSPSEISKVDDRFIGRDRIIKKLKSLLTNNETKTGSYLITGFRGMGKTSFVSKVLSEVSTEQTESITYARYFRILFFLMVIGILDIYGSEFFLLLIIPAILSAVALIYLIATDTKRNNLGLSKKPGIFINYLKAWLRTLIIEKSEAPVTTMRVFIHDFYLLSGIQVLSLLTFSVFEVERISVRFTIYIIFYVGMIIQSNFWIRLRKDKDLSAVRAIFKSFWETIKRNANYSQRIYIKVNFGHDNLREVDILKLIARNMKSRYNEIMVKFSFYSFMRRFARIIVIIFFVGIIYYYEPLYTNLNFGIRIDSGIIHYFPTQGIPLLNNKETFNDLILSDDFKKGEFTLNNIGKLYEGIIEPKNPDLFNLESSSFVFSNDHYIRQTIQRVTVYFDLFIYIIYKQLIKNIFWPINEFQRSEHNQFNKFIGLGINISETFKFIPDSLDYAFISFCILIWLFSRLLARYRFLGLVTHTYIIKRLKELNDMIDSQISMETGGNISSKHGLSFNKKKTKNYPIADIREIEKQLIEILEEINRIPRIWKRTEFIFIFDELDKIEPRRKIDEAAGNESDSNKNTGEENLYFTIEGARHRQQTIMKILGNLKHFLTTAKAKFIFIAGPEMYDFSLADVSDRDFFIGSIFHDVIYVNSFLKDSSDWKLPDVTSLTEAYVCRYLLPSEYQTSTEIQKNILTLKTYNKYLKDNFFNDEDPELTDIEREILKQKREKIIFCLQNFITYLTYRSNGAPKKLTTYFESYTVVLPSRKELLQKDKNLTVGRNNRSFYLFFGYYDQYTFGMITHLISPVFFTIKKSIKDFGDKLLVSTSFLVDHIYKFHKLGFSWRNIEVTPEILEINKAPALRELIEKILQVLSNMHVQKIITGMYDFRFVKKIVEEMSFLSKISEKEAAAFNFTLDESLALKNHYKQKLDETTKSYKDFKDNISPDDFIYSVSFIYMIQGDLSFYDEEYNDAIISYMDAVQTLRSIKKNNMDFNKFVSFIRNMLKLGLVYEKKKSHASAYATYTKITEVIANFLYINVEEENFKIIDLNKTKLNGEYKNYNKLSKNEIKKVQELEEGKTLLAVTREHGQGTNPILYGLYQNLPRIFDRIHPTRVRVDWLSKSSIAKSIRFVYQSLLAKLQILEKGNLGGIDYIDVKRTFEEFDYFTYLIQEENEKYLIKAEFNDKVGDILFYKNGLLMITDDEDNPRKKETHCIKSSPLCSINRDVTNRFGDNELFSPCSACYYYFNSLKTMCENYLEISLKDYRSSVLLKIFDSLYSLHRRVFINQMADATMTFSNILSDIGDSFLSCAMSDHITEKFLLTLISIIKERGYLRKGEMLSEYIENNFNELNKVEEVFVYYYLSAVYSDIGGNSKEYSFQLSKILYLIKEYVIVNDSRELLTDRLIEELEKVILKIALRAMYRAYDNAHRLEIGKHEEIIVDDEENKIIDMNVTLRNISLSAELKELVLLFDEIVLLSGRRNDKFSYNVYNSISPYTNINSMYNRIIELRFKVQINYLFLKELDFHEITDEEGKETDLSALFAGKKGRIYDIFSMDIDARSVLEFLISDSIFCLFEVLRITKVFGSSYLISYSLIADTHQQFGNWCRYYYGYIKNSSINRQNRLRKSVERLIGTAEMPELAPKYHDEMAIKHYKSAIETHSEGKAYKNTIENMFYLIDEYNDNTYHFHAALERYRINTGYTAKQMKMLRKRAVGSLLYEWERYL